MRMLLVDGNHLTGRCHAVMGELITRDGRKSGAIHGFFKSLSYVKNSLKIHTSNVFVFWDGGRAQARKALYPAYKGGRKWNEGEALSPEEEANKIAYYNQLSALKEGLETAGVRQARVDGVEADDLIGIYSSLFSKEGHHIVIYSGDKDMHQLASDLVQIYDPKKELQDAKSLLASWEVASTWELIMYRAIMGDSSDNIAGIPGLGEVRAKLALKHILGEDISSARGADSIKDKIQNGTDIIDRNYKLMRLPRKWDDFPHYTPEQQAQATSSVTAEVSQNTKKFLSFLLSWDLQEVANNINWW